MTEPVIYVGTYARIEDGEVVNGPLVKYDEYERILGQKWSALVAEVAQYRGIIADRDGEIARLKEQRDDFERKGKELCSAYGNSLITTHDLRAEIARLNEGGTELCQLSAKEITRLTGENNRLKAGLQSVWDAIAVVCPKYRDELIKESLGEK